MRLRTISRKIHRSVYKTSRFILIPVLLYTSVLYAKTPFFDVHVHYNWDQAEITDLDTVLKAIEQEHVGNVIVASTPNHLSQRLAEKSPKIKRWLSPYVKPDGKKNWFRDSALLPHVRRELKNGQYIGIGEIHFMAGRLPKPNNQNFLGLVKLANQNKMPMLIHVDASKSEYFIRICRNHQKTRILLAHAGGIYKPAQVQQIINECPNVWVEFSAKDPWRYGGLTDRKGKLLSKWMQVLHSNRNRFMVGSDPVWKVTRGQSWDRADEGWQYYGRLVKYHRRWITNLPKPLQDKLLFENAKKFFEIK